MSNKKRNSEKEQETTVTESKGYKVAMGKAICCSARGVCLSDGAAIEAADLHPDADAASRAMDTHIKAGTIVKA